MEIHEKTSIQALRSHLITGHGFRRLPDTVGLWLAERVETMASSTWTILEDVRGIEGRQRREKNAKSKSASQEIQPVLGSLTNPGDSTSKFSNIMYYGIKPSLVNSILQLDRCDVTTKAQAALETWKDRKKGEFGCRAKQAAMTSGSSRSSAVQPAAISHRTSVNNSNWTMTRPHVDLLPLVVHAYLDGQKILSLESSRRPARFGTAVTYTPPPPLQHSTRPNFSISSGNFP
ncbi:hypothetical protein C8R47DRAFT_1066507 [Mycena vitilis]|nr:hypothetical protein C8R47DRAFT_1066507 [Mycena vitilis]